MTDPSYNTGNAIDTALVRQNYGGPVGLTRWSDNEEGPSAGGSVPADGPRKPVSQPRYSTQCPRGLSGVRRSCCVLAFRSRDTITDRATLGKGFPAESAVMGLCDEIDRLRLDLRSEQMERADADQEVGRLRALADPAPVGLTEKELRLVSDARELAPPNPDYPIPWDRYCKREYGNTEAEALREALRIAVEGLEECGRYERPAVPRGYTHVVALAAVRELVDLGGDDE